MTTVLTTMSGLPLPAAPKEDPFRLGWRYVQEMTPDGEVVATRQVPLTEEDVLHPQEDDFIVNTFWHHEICLYLLEVLQARYPDRQKVLVVGDQRVYWGVPQRWAHGPDIGLFFNLKKPFKKSQGTFHVKKMGARAGMIIEATSPSTRASDYGPKMREYFQVGVPWYVIIDVPEDEELGSINLYGFKAGTNQYVPFPPDAMGRLWLEPVGLWLGVEGNNVYLEEPSGKRLPGYENLAHEAQAAEAKAHKAETKDKKAEAKAQTEAQARIAAKARIKELEDKLAKHKGK